MKIQTIETPRLYLRSFEKEDARFAISIWNDPEMGEYLLDEAMEYDRKKTGFSGDGRKHL